MNDVYIIESWFGERRNVRTVYAADADDVLQTPGELRMLGKSPESNHQHRPTPKWDWSTTERETDDRHARRPAVAR